MTCPEDGALVSCLLFAREHGVRISQAATYFLRQTYEPREFVVVADDPGVQTELPNDPRIRVVSPTTVGSERERWRIAIENIRGAYIAWWNPFDWVGPERLSVQMDALTRSGALVSVVDSVIGFNPRVARAWRCRETRPGELARRTWVSARDHLCGCMALAAEGVGDSPDDVLRAFDGLELARIDAPWYVWMFSGTASPLASRDLAVEPIAVGEAVRTVERDREEFAGLRARGGPLRSRTIAVRHGPRSERSADSAALQGGSHDRRIDRPRGRVSCLMPTFNRPEYLKHAIGCFLTQDYPERELVIVDDSAESIEELVPPLSNIVFLRVRPRRSIGAKRNLAIEAATGEYLMCWDDDDWSGPGRISHQIAPLLAGVRDVTALTTGYILVRAKRQFWRQRRDRAGVLFHQGVNWGTLAWSRSAQESGARFPDCSIAEDVGFKDLLARQGRRIQCLENGGVYVYVRHGGNTWSFPEEKMLRDDQWQPVATPDFFPADARAFYGLGDARRGDHAGLRTEPSNAH